MCIDLYFRTKNDSLSFGCREPILILPPTETVTVNVELSMAEREFYNSLLQRSQSVFEGFIKSGTASKSWFAIFSLLNRLRQTCDHVALTVKSQLDDDEWNPDVKNAALKEIAASPAKRASTPKKASKDKDALGEEVSLFGSCCIVVSSNGQCRLILTTVHSFSKDFLKSSAPNRTRKTSKRTTRLKSLMLSPRQSRATQRTWKTNAQSV